jgi:hypothetical protein
MVPASMEAPLSSTMPVQITPRGPNRSTTTPVTGASRPWIIVDAERAPAVSARDQRNSSSSGTRKIENEKKRP